MTKITYLFGAGASIGAYPLNHSSKQKNGLAKEMHHVGEQLYSGHHPIHSKKRTDVGYDHSNVEKASRLLMEVGSNGDNYDSIDLLAKSYLELKETEKFDNVKKALDLYFLLEQNFNVPEDKRYERLLISLLHNGRFPKQVNFLNWNYDLQIERALEKYKLFRSGHEIHTDDSLVSSFPYVARGELDNVVAPKIFHLNGLAARPFIPVKGDYLNWNRGKDSGIMEALADTMNTNTSLIRFAFEKPYPMSDYPYHSIWFNNLIQATEILVVIGYSFPFFNRSYDREILRNLKRDHYKIYVQNPSFDKSFFCAQFELEESRVEVINPDNFFVPFQFEPE